MKQILGDNQFFGINHNDLEKGNKTKEQFSSKEAIIEFINKSISIGLDGYMINSNEIGFKIPTSFQLPASKEIHYSVPYPHKYASMVNENGMLSLLKYIFKQSSLSSLFLKSPKFLFTRNIKDILPIIIDLEIPAKLPKNSYVYLQNIVTDLVLGLKREDLLLEFCNAVQRKGYKPGLITLNPTRLDVAIQKFPIKVQKDLVVCFNINVTGFNVFPSRETVEKFVKTKHNYKKMGMSILSSGGAHNIEDSIQYIKTLNLDYVVYGSSNLKNIEANYKALKS
jgi:hypothetical protein